MTWCSHVLFPSHLGFLVGSSWCENFNETEIVVLSTWFLVWVSDVLAHTSIDWHTSLRLGLRLVLSKRLLPVSLYLSTLCRVLTLVEGWTPNCRAKQSLGAVSPLDWTSHDMLFPCAVPKSPWVPRGFFMV